MGVGVGVGSSDARGARGLAVHSHGHLGLTYALCPGSPEVGTDPLVVASVVHTAGPWLSLSPQPLAGCSQSPGAAHLPTPSPQSRTVPSSQSGLGRGLYKVSMQNKPTSGRLPSLPPKPQIKTDLGGHPDPSLGTSVAVLCGIFGWLVGPPGVPALPQNCNPLKHDDPHMGVTVTCAHWVRGELHSLPRRP